RPRGDPARADQGAGGGRRGGQPAAAPDLRAHSGPAETGGFTPRTPGVASCVAWLPPVSTLAPPATWIRPRSRPPTRRGRRACSGAGGDRWDGECAAVRAGGGRAACAAAAHEAPGRPRRPTTAGAAPGAAARRAAAGSRLRGGRVGVRGLTLPQLTNRLVSVQ